MTLTDFLLARIAEDEAGDVSIKRVGTPYLPEGQTFYVTPTTDLTPRWAAELEAKRELLRFMPPANPVTGEEPRNLRVMAAVYADHPDFRPEWRL